jgi:hypothetical protein
MPTHTDHATSFHDTVSALAGDAAQLEQVYQAAVKAGEVDAFRQAIEANRATTPDNLLYAAWFHRLQYAAAQAGETFVAWGWVIPLALLNSLLFWWLSDDSRYMVQIAGAGGSSPSDYFPTLILLAAPIAAAFVLAYFTAVSRRGWRLGALIAVGLLAAAVYVLWVYPRAGARPFQEQYLTLMAFHLPLLAWAGVGVYLLVDHRDPTNRFAFLIKSLELFILAGLFVMAGGLLTGITIGLFEALSIQLPEVVQRLFIAGGAGLIPVVVAAVIYNPTLSPADQSFDEGLSKLVALLARVILPLALLVLLVYVAFIPFNFFEPFENRDVLIIFNGMLFAVIALTVGATPVSRAHLSPALERWLRRGLIALVALALLISLYALVAILYRTAIDRLTPNRLAFIGWNVINIGLLITLLVYQERAPAGQWLHELHRAYASGTVAYAAWTLALIIALPWLFGMDQGALDALPPAVQTIVYENADPILLKCAQSPHIYLLEDGQKRWIDTIETFTDRGYVWSDVFFVSCPTLRSVPDGEPIPADAGPPPQP